METFTEDALRIAMANEMEQAKKSAAERSRFIEKYMPFIIKTVSDVTKAYVTVGDSDELSIGMMAFDEAIDRFEFQKGPFIPYAKLVITSRLLNYVERSRKAATEPLEEAMHVPAAGASDSGILAEEIEQWKRELLKFGITFQSLVAQKPKHRDTRERACSIAESASQNQMIVDHMYGKFRLPIQLIHKHLSVSIKIIEGSKLFITSVIIVFVKELGALKRWIKAD